MPSANGMRSIDSVTAYTPIPTNAEVASEMYRVAPEKNDQAVAMAT